MICDCPQSPFFNLLPKSKNQKIKMCETKNFYLWLLQVLALLGLLALLLWLILRPKDPTYTIINFSVPTTNNSNTTSPVNQDSQNGTISYNIEIANPNKDSTIYYDDILLMFYYGDDTIGQKTIPSFHQGKEKSRQIMDHVDASGRIWKALSRAISNATAELKVGLVTRIRYRLWGQTGKHHGMNLQGHLKIGSDGKISGKKKKVKLSHASKKWKSRYA